MLLGHLRHIAHAGKLIHHPSHTAEIIHLLKLVTQIFKIKPFALGYLLGKLLGFLFIDLALNIFDKRHNIAHTQYARGNSLGMEGLKSVGLFADTEEFYRLASDMTHR